MAHDVLVDSAISHRIGGARWYAKDPIVRVHVIWLVAMATVLLVLSGVGRLGAQDTAYVPATAFENGRQIVAIYFGANWCHPYRTPEMKAAIRAMKPLVAAQAKQSGAAFSAMVVVLDRDLKSGLEFVAPLGAFDEYSFGSDLESAAAQRFIWGDSLAFKGVPQVIVFERTIQIQRNKPINFGNDHVLRRVSGDSIATWVGAGAPIR